MVTDEYERAKPFKRFLLFLFFFLVFVLQLLSHAELDHNVVERQTRGLPRKGA